MERHQKIGLVFQAILDRRSKCAFSGPQEAESGSVCVKLCVSFCFRIFSAKSLCVFYCFIQWNV